MDNDIIFSDPERLKELHEAYVSIIHQLPEYTENDINKKWDRYNELKEKPKLNEDETKELDILTFLFFPINDIITSDNVALYNRFKRNLEKIKKIFYVNTIILEIISYILELTDGDKNKLIDVIDHLDKNIKDNYSNYYEFEFLNEDNKKEKSDDNNEYYDNLLDEIEKAYNKLKEKYDQKNKKKLLNKINIEIDDDNTPESYKMKFKHLKEKIIKLKDDDFENLPSMKDEDNIDVSLPSIKYEDNIDVSLPSAKDEDKIDENLPSIKDDNDSETETDNDTGEEHEYNNLIFEINDLIKNYDTEDTNISDKISDLHDKISSFKSKIYDDSEKLANIKEYDDDLNTLASIDKIFKSESDDDNIDIDNDKVEKFIEKYIDDMTNSDTIKQLQQIVKYLESDQDQNQDQTGGKCKINSTIINDTIRSIDLMFDKLINIESTIKSKDPNVLSIKKYLNEYVEPTKDKNKFIVKGKNKKL